MGDEVGHLWALFQCFLSLGVHPQHLSVANPNPFAELGQLRGTSLRVTGLQGELGAPLTFTPRFKPRN